MGVAKEGDEYAPTTFFGKDVWWRGIADLLIVNGEKAYLIDYKTGKNAVYADTKQLDLLAAATFTHFPDVEVIKSALLYVVSNDFIRKKHTAELRKSYLTVFDDELERLEVALEEGVWNAVESGLCAYCPVTSCEHNRK
jgi:RecB family exonuclease